MKGPNSLFKLLSTVKTVRFVLAWLVLAWLVLNWFVPGGVGFGIYAQSALARNSLDSMSLPDEPDLMPDSAVQTSQPPSQSLSQPESQSLSQTKSQTNSGQASATTSEINKQSSKDTADSNANSNAEANIEADIEGNSGGEKGGEIDAERDAGMQMGLRSPFESEQNNDALSLLPRGETFQGKPLLKGRVSTLPENNGSPLLSGSLQMVPKGTSVDLTLQCHLNSELSQKGQEVFARISRDVIAADGSKVVLPGKWVAHGFVTRVDRQKHNGRDGFVEVKFDKIISPDGQYEVPFETTFSTKDNELKSVAKVVLRDTKFATIGALAGSIMSVQMTGLPVAISTYGISVGIGGGIGATYGIACAVARKGKICSVYPGDHVKLKISEPLSLPGFNPLALDSARSRNHLPGLSLIVADYKFEKDPLSKDKNGQILRVNFIANNRSKQALSLRNVRVISDFDEVYAPHISAAMMRFKELSPGSSQNISLPFSVDSKKQKYWLIMVRDSDGTEQARVEIN
ncbi:MAG: hypothetical protein J0M35_07660 [Candidatus Obscuribacter phosphatis]|uniref:Uncharacterized protein n=1 Tax=Candidatus Obscuribacter phosphatis TaxID=1906157 RepID=A0A8J7PI89_9BACT|nr:hypothetical protein [Candidatus Obscuribacter phosphatis]